MRNILISCGESSGDIHAAKLVENLKRLNPGVGFYGIGGKELKKEGVKLIETIENLSVIGVWEILEKFSYIRNAKKRLFEEIKKVSPVCAILIDYPGFNLLLAKKLKSLKIPVIYYITPQVWAWGAFRIKIIKKYVDKVIVIFKFEEELFKKYSIDSEFVGHPILDQKRTNFRSRESLGLKEDMFTIALLPGSRDSEVKILLPIMLKTANLIYQKKKDIQFILLKTSHVKEALYKDILKDINVPFASLKDNTYACLTISDFVFTASGTATLESAIMEKPMLIVYRTSLLTALLFKIFGRIPYIGLVNIVAGKRVCPEILQYKANPANLASQIISIISSTEKMQYQIENLKEIKSKLGKTGASYRAAHIIHDFIKQRQ